MRTNVIIIVLVGIVIIFAATACDDHAGESLDQDRLAEILDKAAEEVSYFSFAQAFELFEQAKESAPAGSDQWQQAVYGAAVCAQQISPSTKSKIEESKKLYLLLLESNSDSRFAARAMLNLGRIAELSDYHEDYIDLSAARDCYQKVVDKCPAQLIASEAALRMAGSYIQTYEHDQIIKGIDILEKWLLEHPQDELSSAMWQYLGDTYFYPLEEYAKSLSCYRKAEEIGFIEKGRRGPVYWRMAAMADRFLNDRESAVEYYSKIITLVPTSGKAYEAQLALKRLGAPVPELQIFENLTTSSSPPASQSAQ